MKKFTLFLIFLFAGALEAQQSHGYFFLAPGGIKVYGHTDKFIHLGAGIEGILGRGVGVGGELGALGATANYADSLVGLLSLNGYYHFAQGRTKFDPFATAGYSLMFRSGHANLFNFGGGFNYWFTRVGFKAEFRDHVRSVPGTTAHYWEIRLGLIVH